MKGKVFKSIIVQMIGFLLTRVVLGEYQAVAMGYFIAVWCSRLIRIPIYPIMVAGLFLTSGLLVGAKYALVMFAIMIVFYIMEGKQSRVPILVGALLGGGILYAMEITDIYMSSSGGNDKLLLASLSTILAMSLSILFYKVIEIFQMPRSKVESREDKDGYREKLDSYEEKMSCISDAFARMAKSIERVSVKKNSTTSKLDDDGELGYCIDDECLGCKMLMRQNKIYRSKLMESRKIIATQLLEMSKILGESLGNTYDLRGVTKEEMGLLTEKLRELGIVLKKVVRLDNNRGISEIILTMRAKRNKCIGIKQVSGLIGRVFGKDVEIINENRRIVDSEIKTYRFRERPNFYMLHGLAKANCCEDVSGDNFSCLSLDTGQTLLGISDGMGSGIKAYKDSEMVLELLENLVESGFSEETAIKLINTIFVIDGEDVNPATVDMGIIDMYSGMCDFMKMGAAPTYVKRGGWVETIQSTSLPMGGSDEVDIESTTKKLYDGDFVIMMSDGIVEMAARQNKEDMIGEIISEMDELKPQEMARQILNRALIEFGEDCDDDLTVFVTGIWNVAV